MSQVIKGNPILIRGIMLKFLKTIGFGAADMHFHTQYSMDAVSRIKSMLAKVRKTGIGVAITDHNEIEGALHAFRIKKDELVIPGIELSLQEGPHLLAYFFNIRELKSFYNKFVKPLKKKNPFFLPIGREQIAAKIKRHYDVVLSAPHPFGPGVTGVRKLPAKKSFFQHIDCVEVFNSVCLNEMNKKAYNWALKKKKSMTGGSDGHLTKELGNAFTVAYGEDYKLFLHSLLRGKNLVFGKRENVFINLLHQFSKEKHYLKEAKKHHIGRLWIKTHIDKELDDLHKKFKKERTHTKHRYQIHHQEITEEHKEFIKKHEKYYGHLKKYLKKA